MIKKKNILRLKTTEIEFRRGTAGYNLLDIKANKEILEELVVESVENKIQKFKYN